MVKGNSHKCFGAVRGKGSPAGQDCSHWVEIGLLRQDHGRQGHLSLMPSINYFSVINCTPVDRQTTNTMLIFETAVYNEK